MKRLIIPCLAVALACSVSLKQAVSSAHLAARSAVVALDDAEQGWCQPDATKIHCTNAAAVDATHHDFSTRLIAFYTKDKAISQLIIDWHPGTPIPADLTSAITEAERFLADAQTLAPTLTGKAQAVLEHFKDLLRHWIGGRP